MALDKETVGRGATHPGTPLEILQSAAGYYLGHLDTDGSPYSRETGYFRTWEEAEAAHASGEWEAR